MKKKRKSNKGLIALLAIALIAAPIGGVYAAQNFSETDIAQQVYSKFNIETSTDKNVSNVDSLLDLQARPESSDDGYSTEAIYEMVNPSVVSINVYVGTSISAVSAGTGIVMTQDGYIITNAHVVDGGTSFNVVFDDESQARGEIIGVDVDTDLAVIKVDKTGLTPANFADSEELKIGERVIAIGNAGGLSNTLTQGVVSGLKREVDANSRSLDLIQVDAAINPGNSGGPLINRYGQVVGINSSKIADVEFEGIGFAIPTSDAKPIIDSLIQNGYVTGRAVLGVSVIELNATNGPPNGLPSKGIYIATINADSDLIFKGVRERDVLIKAGGEELTTTDDLLEVLEDYSPKEEINLEIYRPETDETFSVDVILSEAK